MWRHSWRRDPLEPGLAPSGVGAVLERLGGEGRGSVRPKISSAPERPERIRCSARMSRRASGDRNPAAPRVVFSSISPSFSVPAVLDADHARRRGRRRSPRSACSSPRRSPAYIAVAQIARSRSGTAAISASASSGAAIAVAPPRRPRQLEAVAGIDGELATADGTAEHRPDREQGAAHRRRVQPSCRAAGQRSAWRSDRRTSASRAPPISGSTRSRIARS